MSYQEALDYIWTLVNFETTPPETRGEYTLERMDALMARLGNPQARLRAVHIAGTKGKGSTSAMLESVLRAAGHRTGFYSSPHLHDARERLRMDGKLISEDDFVALVERLRPEFEAFAGITTFEALTAMAFLWFAEAETDVAVFEVGLGGRLDATNLITPLVSVITPLGLEHTAVLGNTIEEIAAEKGGIIKRGVPVVTSAQPPAALDVLRRIADERAAPLHIVAEQWEGARTLVSLDGQRFDIVQVNWGNAPLGEHEMVPHQTVTSVEMVYHDLQLPLLGAHQVANATLAVLALHTLRDEGIAWNEAALREGLSSVQWPARVEVLGREPLVIVDGAHTLESADALVAALRDALPDGWGQSTLVLGIMRDKPLESLLPAFEPLANRVILTRARHLRAADPATLAAHPALAGHEVQVIPDVAEAVRLALAGAGPTDLVVATGSLFVAAEARAALGKT